MESARSRSLSRFSSRSSVRAIAVLTVVELLLLALYFLGTPATLTEPRYALYPFVWINVGLWAVVETDVPEASGRRWVAALAIAVFYFATLVTLAGLVGFDVPDLAGSKGFFVGQGSPGLAGFTVVTDLGYVAFVPYRVLGYLALTYLVYATVLDASASLVGGTIGLLSCLTCSFPIVASLVAAVGGSSALTSALFQVSLDVSTTVFVLAVALLYVRPGLPGR